MSYSRELIITPCFSHPFVPLYYSSISKKTGTTIAELLSSNLDPMLPWRMYLNLIKFNPDANNFQCNFIKRLMTLMCEAYKIPIKETDKNDFRILYGKLSNYINGQLGNHEWIAHHLRNADLYSIGASMLKFESTRAQGYELIKSALEFHDDRAGGALKMRQPSSVSRTQPPSVSRLPSSVSRTQPSSISRTQRPPPSSLPVSRPPPSYLPALTTLRVTSSSPPTSSEDHDLFSGMNEDDVESISRVLYIPASYNVYLAAAEMGYSA